MLSRCLQGAILAAIVTSAAAGVPKLNSLSRDWVQRGGTAHLRVQGENLAGVTNVLISGASGLAGRIAPAEPARIEIESSGSGVRSVVRPDEKSVEITLEIAADAALSDREIRLVSGEGVSNPILLHVSPLPEADASGNESRDKAQALEIPVAVTGVIRADAESDYFRLRGTKGQRLIAEVYASRIGSKLDSSLAILSADGKELGRNEDAVGLDSVLDYEFPDDGEYLLELRDFRYEGGGDFNYRLLVGILPHVRRSFPFGGQRGQTIDISLEGSNLDSQKLSIQLASDAATGRQELRASSSHGLSNPFPFYISDLPHVSESEPNTALDQADRIQPPVAITGKIGQKKDYDAFRFHAAAEQRLVFEVEAARYGSPLDALLILTDSVGNVLQRNDDAAGEDARIDYTFRTEEDYHIIIEDLLGRGGDDFGYLLTIQQPKPDFSLIFLQDTPRLRQGGRIPIRCEVNRMNGFGDAVIVTAENLPQGVYAEELMLAPGLNSDYLVITASGDAPLGSFPLQIAARAKNLIHQATPQNGDRRVQQAFLTILPPAPFSISPATLMASIEQNQSGKIDVLVERRNGWNGELKIVPEGFSPGREPITRSFDIEGLTLKPGDSRGTLSLKTKVDSEIATRRIFLRAEASPELVAYSPAIPLQTAEIPFVLSTSLKKLVVTALKENSGSAAAEAAFNAKISRRGGFEGEVELKLEGVPQGVTAYVTNIAEKASESALKLIATEKAPTGTNVQLTLTGFGHHHDRTYRFQAPPITLSINAPEGADKKEQTLATKP